MVSRNIRELLKVVKCDGDGFFDDCYSLEDEYKRIRKNYLKLCLRTHPDKGGDPAEFRRLNTSFEALKALVDKGQIPSFSDNDAQSQDVGAEFEQAEADFDTHGVHAWEYYAAAEEQEEPPYRVEAAKSGRSRCSQKSKKYKQCMPCGNRINLPQFDTTLGFRHDAPEFILKGETRIGRLNQEYGNYANWKHVRCWRVPYKVWAACPDPAPEEAPFGADGRPHPEKFSDDPSIFRSALLKLEKMVLSGFKDLDSGAQDDVVAHVMNKKNWARYTKPKRSKSQLVTVGSVASSDLPNGAITTSSKSSPSPSSSTQIVKQKRGMARWVKPVPGQGDYKENAMKGKTVVMTGMFPEVGGGTALALGKARLKQTLESFGARVTSAVSGKTDFLIVGKEPGAGKINKARAQQAKGKPIQIVDLRQMQEACKGLSIANLPEPEFGRLSEKSVARLADRPANAPNPAAGTTSTSSSSKQTNKGKALKDGKKVKSEKKSERKKRKKKTDTKESKQPSKKKAKTSKSSSNALVVSKAPSKAEQRKTLMKNKIAELRKMCDAAGLDSTGTKKTLCSRLLKK